MIVANAPDAHARLPADVRDLLARLESALRSDLQRAPYAPPLGLLVLAIPRPDDTLLDDLHGEPGGLHDVYPLFGLQAIALRYARDVARALWDVPPFGFVWCLLLVPERACVVPFRA
jgi:hypothetical protein